MGSSLNSGPVLGPEYSTAPLPKKKDPNKGPSVGELAP